MSLKVGQVIDNYCILEQIGSGGNGIVYKAQNEENSEIVAIKIPWSENIKKDPRLADNFAREISAITRLEHPNIAKSFQAGIYLMGEDEERLSIPYLVMEFAKGKSLITENYLPARDIVELVQKVATSVAYAHTMRIIHRDLKPSNIFVDEEGNPKILDFGLAKMMDQISSNTSIFEGSPAYAAPEQFRGESCDERTDIWALGAILFELLTGKPPFIPENWDELSEVQRIFAVQEIALNKKLTRPSKINDNIDKHLDNICIKALAKKPEDRYQNAEDMANDLKQWGRINRDLQAERASRLFSCTGVFPKPIKKGLTEKAFEYLRKALSYDTATTPLKNLVLRLFKSQGFSEVSVAEMPFSRDLTKEEWEVLQEQLTRAADFPDDVVIPITKFIPGIGQGEELPRQALLVYEKPKGKNISSRLADLSADEMVELVLVIVRALNQARDLSLQPRVPDFSEIFVDPFQVLALHWPFANQKEIPAKDLAALIYNLFVGVKYDQDVPNWGNVPDKFRDVLRTTLQPGSPIATLENFMNALERKLEAYKILKKGSLNRSFTFPAGEYWLDRWLRIEKNGHLKLSGETILRFAPGIGIECLGKITANGKWDEDALQGSVQFLPEDVREGWAGIRFLVGVPNEAQSIIGCTFESGQGTAEDSLICGGAIHAEAGTFKFEECCFRGNKVENNGGALHFVEKGDSSIEAEFSQVVFTGNHSQGHGGVIYAHSCHKITLNDCHFEGNRSGEDGGCLYIRGRDGSRVAHCEIQRSTFSENRSQISGGTAYFNFYSVASVEDCQYDGNIAEDSGGAIAIVGKEDLFSKLRVDKSKFTGNRCQNRGGAIVAKKGTQITLEKLRFGSNSSDRDSGGAIAIDGKGIAKQSLASLSQVVFSENRCRVDGGAVNANINSHLSLEGCRFEGNYSEDNSGGAVVIVGGAEETTSEAKFIRTTFHRNRCKLDGGAVNANVYTRTLFENCRFKNNSAEDSGGAIEIAGDEGNRATEANFKEVVFFGNRCKISGGAINAIDLTKTNFDSCRFENNRSEEDSGAIQIKGTDCEKYSETIFRSTRFLENRSKLFAGALFLHVFTRAKLEDCRFNGNQAESKNGGAIQILGKREKNATEVSFCRVNFTENFCGGDGASLNMGFCSLAILDDVRFERNLAENSGGAIAFIGKGDEGTSKMTLRRARFTENRSKVDGGAIAAGPHTQMILETCKFHANKAQGSCGAIGIIGKSNAEPSKAKFRKVSFTENQCKGDGGAMAAGIHSRVIFEDCKFEKNWAEGCCGALGIAGKDSKYLSDATFSKVRFIGNHCEVDGGALILGRFSRVKFSQCLFEKNYAEKKTGGAILVLGGEPTSPTIATFKESTFLKNYCAVDGGAINANIYSHLMFELCHFEGNFAKEKNGGAIVLLGQEGGCYTEATFRKVQFIQNHCRVSGGAINANDYTRSRFIECTFDGNRALTKNGGAVLILGENSQEPSDAKFSQVEFKNNYCKGSGGGVNAHVYTITGFEKCNFQTNIADENGGGIFVRGLRRVPNKATVKGCHFLGNIAGNIGADVALHAVKGVTERSLMEENTIEIPPPDFQEEEKQEQQEQQEKNKQNEKIVRQYPK